MNNLKAIGESFQDESLFVTALTHRSYINENRSVSENNERLEFLGDAVLEYVVSSFIFKEYPNKEEGFLTALRANIVNTQNLAELSKRLGLGKELRLSKGEEQGNGRNNESLLADTLEALIGAIYIDRGLSHAEEFIQLNLLSDVAEYLKTPLKDAKSRLQEAVQSGGMPTPKYRVVKESGPDHAKEFEVEVFVENKMLASGKGKSKNRAEQDAATEALARLEADVVK